MSNSKSKAHHPNPNFVDDELKPPEMSTRKRIMLIGVAIFCLVIFSVTGPMMMAFDSLFLGGPAAVATAQLPSGEVSLTQEDLFYAARLLESEKDMLSPGLHDHDDPNTRIAYALLRKLADDIDLVVHPSILRGYIQSMIQSRGFPDYKSFLAYYRYPTAVQFESHLADMMRVPLLEGMLSNSQLPEKDDILGEFKKRYQEFQAQYLIWNADDFAAATMALDPTEEELTEFFDNGLNFTQRQDLQLEETVTFDVLLLSADALQTDVVAAWAPQEEPSEEELGSFYDFNKRFLYMRPIPEELEDPAPEPFLSREELGDDLKRDFILQRAILTLVAEAGEAEDLQAFADSKGLEWIQQTDPVTRTQLLDLPRIGTDQLNQLFRFELNQWLGRAILNDGVAFLARPIARTEATLPPLEEVKDSVVDYWRESQQPVLARRAAEDFQAKFPAPEVEGDAIIVDADGFTAAAAEFEMDIYPMDWISKTRRPATDPIWPADDKISPWLRGQVGRTLEDYEAGQLIGPLEYTLPTEKYIVMVRLIDVRDPDENKIWPNELNSLRFSAYNTASRKFQEEQLSFNGLVTLYDLKVVEVKKEEEEE
ncbi:MAG: peptidyl-prolyl cis-trans isomerase [Planctomycetes bacterium]|nr:peptidyl-prolyl cis-trans isomerase [Planctomycetota bacterium]